MGGAVSSGRDNNELIDNLMGGNYIRTRAVERVFRALDRAEYMTPETRDQAYKDLAWRSGPLHLSAPCIYSEVLEGLELKPGLSFLNIGSGTGYFSTLVGMLIGSGGINHGVEAHPYVLEYAIKRLGQFIENSPLLDEFDFCVPKFYEGNGLCLPPTQAPYDRVYCGAGCPLEYHNYFKHLVKVGGVLVMPLNEQLVQIKRLSVDGWSSRILLNVSFATLKIPTKEEATDLLKLEEQCPPRLQILSRAVVRSSMRASLMSRFPNLKEPPPRRPLPTNSCPRRICIPIEDDSDVDLNALHDLDQANGANEMNALLSLVLSMGQNRVAGALRFDSLESPSSASSDDEPDNDGNGDGGDDDDPPNGPDGHNQSDDSNRPDRPNSSDSTDRPDASYESARSNRRDRLNRSDRSSRSDCTDRSDRSDRPDRLDRPNRPDRPDRSERRSSSGPSNDDSLRPVRFGPIRTQHGLITFEYQDESKRSGGSRRVTPGTSRDTDKSDNSDNNAAPKKGTQNMTGVPAEVEIYLGKEVAGTSRSDMDWEEPVSNKKGSSSEEDTTTASKEKRKKLDSGIGEGTTTSSSSSPVKTESNEGEESDAGIGKSDVMSEDENIGGDRKRQKRGRFALGPYSSSSSSPSPSEESGDDAPGGGARRRKRRAAARAHRAALRELRPRRSGDARRVRLSILMKRGVKDLPLPYALKKYVNLGRCFEF